VGGDLLSYLEMAKRAAAKLRAERVGYEGNEVNEVSDALPVAVETSFVSFVNFVARYRALLRAAFRLVADASAADPAMCTRILDEVAVLTDELGPDRAQRVRREEAQRWWEESVRCPWCGESGQYHDSEETRR
jgi:hypothetical protein